MSGGDQSQKLPKKTDSEKNPTKQSSANGSTKSKLKSKETLHENKTTVILPVLERQHDGQSKPCDKSQSEIDEVQEQFDTLASSMEHLFCSLPTVMMEPLNKENLEKFKVSINNLNKTFCEISDKRRKKDNIRIASWNVKQLSDRSIYPLLYEDRVQSIVDTIKFYGFQLIAFQEIYKGALEDIRDKLGWTGHAYKDVHKSGVPEGAAFLWDQSSEEVFDPSDIATTEVIGKSKKKKKVTNPNGKTTEVTYSDEIVEEDTPTEEEDTEIEKLVRKIFCLKIKLKGTDYELRNVHLKADEGKQELGTLMEWHKKNDSGEKNVMYLGDFNYDFKDYDEHDNYHAVFPSTESTNTLKDKCYDNFFVHKSIYERIYQRKVAEIQCKSSIVGQHTTFITPTKTLRTAAIHTIETSLLSPQTVSDHCPIYVDLTEEDKGQEERRAEENGERRREEEKKKKKEEEEEKKVKKRRRKKKRRSKK